MTKYRITFEEYNLWSITLDASNLAEAIQQAEELWHDEGPDAGFEILNSCTDNWEGTS